METAVDALLKQLSPQYALVMLILYLLLDKSGVVRWIFRTRAEAQQALTERQVRLIENIGKDNQELRARLDELEEEQREHGKQIRQLQVSEDRLRLLARELVECAEERKRQIEAMGGTTPDFRGYRWFLARGGTLEEIGAAT